MIAGHLQEKKGLYYMVLSYKDKRRGNGYQNGCRRDCP